MKTRYTLSMYISGIDVPKILTTNPLNTKVYTWSEDSEDAFVFSINEIAKIMLQHKVEVDATGVSNLILSACKQYSLPLEFNVTFKVEDLTFNLVIAISYSTVCNGVMNYNAATVN